MFAFSSQFFRLLIVFQLNVYFIVFDKRISEVIFL